MLLLVLTWPYALVFWAVFVWAFASEFRIVARRNEGWAGAQDANSKRILMLAQTVGMTAAFAIASAVSLGALPYPMLLFAALIMFFGIGLALANWISLATLLAFVFVAFLYRVGVEERALVTVIGDPYRRYMQRTKRFVPFVF